MSGVSEEQQEDSVTEQKSVGVENGEVLRSWKTWGPMYHGRIFGCNADESTLAAGEVWAEGSSDLIYIYEGSPCLLQIRE